ncbi:MAG: hypothetical protein HGA76_06105 [Candidatus Firestonebacteria bacterium]|nr:hypothetical protein [Candidatus Firestonebacteria bacterium]
MPKLKGTILTVMRELFARLGKETEAKFLADLTPEELVIYHTGLPGKFIEVDSLTGLITKAAGHLFPKHPHPIRELGRYESKIQLTGIYKFFLNVASLGVVVKTYPAMWKTYADSGNPIVKLSDDRVELEAEGWLDMPMVVTEKIGGFMIGIWELMGYQEIKLQIPAKGKWILTWK